MGGCKVANECGQTHIECKIQIVSQVSSFALVHFVVISYLKSLLVELLIELRQLQVKRPTCGKDLPMSNAHSIIIG